MRTSILFLGVAIGIGGASVPVNACNARGEFCSYPGWAANAFTSEDGRVPDHWRDDSVAFGYLDPGYGYAPLRAYGYGPAYGYAPAYAAPGYEYVERRYRWRDGR